MKISFDPAKRDATLSARGLDMAEAAQVFAGPQIEIEDEREDYGERRFIVFGLMNGRMVVCVHTDRGDERRIISLRKANAREQALYRDIIA